MYDKDTATKQYQEEIKHIVKQLRNLAFCFDTFLIAHETAKEYCMTSGDLSAMAKSAFTKAILVDYSTPFMPNELEKGKREHVSTKYLLKSEYFDNEIIDALLELRHNLIAHAHFEIPGLSVSLTSAVNTRRDDNTHEAIYIPCQYFLQNSSMLFISDAEILSRIEKHLNLCKTLTFSKARELCKILGERMLAYAPVANTADCTNVLQSQEGTGFQARGNTDPLNITAKNIKLKIGDANIQFTISRFRHDAPFIGEYRGNGYIIRFDRDEKNKSIFRWNVSFPQIKAEA